MDYYTTYSTHDHLNVFYCIAYFGTFTFIVLNQVHIYVLLSEMTCVIDLLKLLMVNLMRVT